jgi:uncharacterized DUF497 family protein
VITQIVSNVVYKTNFYSNCRANEHDWSLFLVVCTNVHTIIEMVYQWSKDKATANFRKHGIDFADAVSVFSDDLAITIPDERFIVIGIDSMGRVLVVVYTMRDSEIRLISARRATRHEQQQYEGG